MPHLNGRRYGAIVWTASARLDDAIRFVKAVETCHDALRLVGDVSVEGDRWAVVDLATLTVTAEGHGPVPAAAR